MSWLKELTWMVRHASPFFRAQLIGEVQQLVIRYRPLFAATPGPPRA